jgi:hypothetical protein
VFHIPLPPTCRRGRSCGIRGCHRPLRQERLAVELGGPPQGELNATVDIAQAGVVELRDAGLEGAARIDGLEGLHTGIEIGYKTSPRSSTSLSPFRVNTGRLSRWLPEDCPHS